MATFGRWAKGVNNRTDPSNIPDDALLDAVNVDIDTAGKVTRRKGVTQIYAAQDRTHSIRRIGGSLYFADGTTLRRLRKQGENWTADTVATGFSGSDIDYVQPAERTYLSDGVTTASIRPDGSVTSWGIETPGHQPTLAASAGGSLLAGTYLVATTFADADREESGADLAASVEVAANGSIVLTDIPQPTAAGVASIEVYVSAANGSVMYRRASLPVGRTSHVFSSLNDEGAALATQFMAPFPACSALEFCQGRVWGAAGPILWYSEPLRYGLHSPARNYIPFAADITLIAAVKDGLFVCADKTYFLPLPLEGVRLVEVLPYGGIRGTRVRSKLSTWIGWFSPYGQVLGYDGGQIKVLTEDRIAAKDAADGAAIHIARGGIENVVTTLRGGERSALAVSDFCEAEIRRGG